ncbi:MAG: peptidyl-prolyl cis-trans isomerase, partial [Bacteroidia bacterium]|nr:peptidyl-prolyl cis-trans isomerase [Bacteroidia bacterium]
MFKHLIYIVLLTLSTYSCINHQDDKVPIAKVYDNVLFLDDVKEMMPEQLTKEDSILFVTSYINKWAKEQLLLQKAKINLQEENENINALVNQYRQDLLINKYKEAVVEQELDTLVTEVNIETFYSSNKDIFKLNEELVKFRY